MISIYDENSLPICITLVKEVQDNFDSPIMNAAIQLKTLIYSNKDLRSQVLDYLKNKDIFSGLVEVVVSKFDKEKLLNMINHNSPQLYSELVKEFQKSEVKVDRFSVWVKKENRVDILEDQ